MNTDNSKLINSPQFPFLSIDSLCLADMKNSDGGRILILFRSSPPSDSTVVAACAYHEHHLSKTIETKNIWVAQDSKFGPTVKILIAQRALRRKWVGVIPDQAKVSQAAVDMNCHLYCKNPSAEIHYQQNKVATQKLECLKQMLSVSNCIVSESIARKNYLTHLKRYDCWWHKWREKPNDWTESLWFTPEGVRTQGMAVLAHQSTGQGVGIKSKHCNEQCQSSSQQRPIQT